MAGFGAGFVNAVAGGGSALTVPLVALMADANIANGTIRVAVFFANIAGVSAYQQGKSIAWRRVALLLPPVLAGSAAGAWTATRLPPEGMQKVFAVVLLLVALSVVFRMNRWLEDVPSRLSPFWRTVVFTFIGFYGGFIQVGVGILLLTALVLGSGFDLLRGNGAKVALILVYTVVALPFYFIAGHVNLRLGLILAAGYSLGAYLAARLAVSKGAAWARWVLVVASVGAAIRMMIG